MKNNYILPKDKLNELIVFFKKDYKVAASVKQGKGSYAYKYIEPGDEISFGHIPSILPPKKYFMPQYETLLEYNIENGQHMDAVVEFEKIVLFGVHTCDIAGIQCLNSVFSDRPKDINYLVRRNNIFIIGVECLDYCDKYASCGMMNTFNPSGGYDMMFTEFEDYYYVESKTEFAEDVIGSIYIFYEAEHVHRAKLNLLREEKQRIFKPEVDIQCSDIPKLFEETFDSNVWNEIGRRCISCANCTNVCPTCYCFDVMDEMDINMKSGKRFRVWDSCQNEPFAKVAGGENFRENRSDRKRHRFYRKFKYPVDKYHKFFCTGCGRCSRSCMVKIDLKETISDLILSRG